MSKLWNNKEYSLKDLPILTDEVLGNYINLFWKDVMSQIKDNQHVLLLIRVKFENNQIATLSDMQTINKSSKDYLLGFIKDKFNLSNETYKITPISSIIFSYGFREGKFTPSLDLTKNKNIKYQIYYRNELPIAMVPEDYGKILSKIDNNYTILVNRGHHNAIIALIVKKTSSQTVNHIRYIKNNKLLFNWTDTIVSLQDKNFIREIGKSIIHYKDGEISLFARIKPTRPMVAKKLPKITRLGRKFIVMDLETITFNNTLIPYLLCWFDGKIKKHYFITPPAEIGGYVTSNQGSKETSFLALVQDAMVDICKRKYKGYKIYLHNFSKFDGYFLIRQLSQLGVCDPIIHKGKIINCKFRLYESKYSVTFMDSYLMLPSSLKD